MKKRILALFMILAMSLTACSSEKVAVEYGDVTVSEGVYSYYQSAAYNYAILEVESGEDVLTATIDGMTGEEYIDEQTLIYCLEYIWTKQYFEDNDMEFDDEDQETIDSLTEVQWYYFEDTFASAGVSFEDFDDAYSQQNMRMANIFENIFTGDGEQAVDSDEVYNYVVENKYAYEFIYVPTYYLDAEADNYGETLSDEDSQALFEKFEAYEERVADGESVYDLATEYADESGFSSAPYYEYVVSKDYDGTEENFIDVLESLDGNETEVFYSSDMIILINKYDIDEVATIIVNDESNYLSMLYEYKYDEFVAIIDAAKEEISAGLTLNQSVIDDIEYVNLFS